MPEPSIGIVGGGVSGLSLAYFLSRQQPSRSITLLESSGRLGGVLHTLRGPGFHIEAGADSFDAREPATQDLCRDLGLGVELSECSASLKRVSLVGAQCFYPVDLSFSGLKSFFQNPALSFKGRLRLLMEPLCPSQSGASDESVASFIQRRFGHEFLEAIARPAIQGILLAAPESLSVRAYFPEWVQLERRFGGMAKKLFEHKQTEDKEPSFQTLRGGLEGLIPALRENTPGLDIQLHAEVVSVKREKMWELALTDGRVFFSDALCLALPAPAIARILLELDPALSEKLRCIRYEMLVTVPMVFSKDAVPPELRTPGFMIPLLGKRGSFASLKVIGVTEDGKFVRMRAFLSSASNPETVGWEDARLQEEVLRCLRLMGKIEEDPVWISTQRYPAELPLYAPGHLEDIIEIEEGVRKHEGLHLLGNGFSGFGISECLRRARLVAPSIGTSVKPGF